MLHIVLFIIAVKEKSRNPTMFNNRNMVKYEVGWDFPSGLMVNNLPSNGGDRGFIPDLGN